MRTATRQISGIAIVATLLAGTAASALATAAPGSRALAALVGSGSEPVPRGEVRPVVSGTAEPIARSAGPAKAAPATTEGSMVRPFLSAIPAPASTATAAPIPASGPAPTGPSPLTPSVTASFEGMNRDDALNNGYHFSPPDTIVAKGPSQVLEAANSALRLSAPDGTPTQTMDLNTFFGAPHNDAANGGLDLLYDPRVYFDRNSPNQRFLITAAQSYGTSDKKGVSALWLAVSRSNDPSSLDPADWCRYGINMKFFAGTKYSSWLDYPMLGVGRDAILVSGNLFRFTDSSYTYPVVNVFDKKTATKNAGGCPNVPYSIFIPTSQIGSSTAFALQPVQSYNAAGSFKGTKNPAYLLSTDITAGTSTKIHVWRVRNVASGAPTMALKSLNGTFQYTEPPPADQPGSTGVLMETGDTRIQGAVSKDNTLYGAFTSGCQMGSGPPESCTVFVQVKVGQTKKGALKASLSEELPWGLGDDTFAWDPSLAVNQNGQVASAVQVSSADQLDPNASYLGSVWLLKNAGALQWTTQVPLPGVCALPADPPAATARTGDFTGVQTDPNDGLSFWYAAEFAQNIGGTCGWSTRIAQITP